MKKYKICVYAICKNEEQFVDRWMQSMKEADMVIVTDTGSEDNTVNRLKELGAIVYVEKIEPWRFDTARNISLSKVPIDADICVCTDLDEVFEPGWRKILENAWEADATMGKYLYNWSLKPDNTPDVHFNYFKIHNRHGYKWVYPVHECLSYIGKEPEKIIYIDGLVLNHYPDPNKSRASYLPLLELGVKENPYNDRMMYYLGREYMYRGMWNKCIQTLKRHLELPASRWNEERCASMRWIAKSYYKLANIREAYSWYFRAIAEANHMREPYIECALMAYELENWPMTFFMAQEALKITKKSSTYINMGYAWDHTPDDLCAISCYYLGMYDRSLYHAKAALSYSPDDKRLQKNLMLIEQKLNSRI